MNPDNLLQYMLSQHLLDSDSSKSAPPSYLQNKLFQQTTETKADVTGVAHDEIDALLIKDEVRTQSLLDFINNSIGVSEEINAEETSYGQAIAKLVKEHNSPFINQREPQRGSFFPDEPLASWSQDTRDPSLSSWPVDTLNVRPGNISDLQAELAHQRQFNVSPKTRQLLYDRLSRELKLYSDPYDIPGTVEHEAHSVIEPIVQKRFETLLDSIRQTRLGSMPHINPLQ